MRFASTSNSDVDGQAHRIFSINKKPHSQRGMRFFVKPMHGAHRRLYWLPREDSNLGPSGYTWPAITNGSGLSLHHAPLWRGLDGRCIVSARSLYRMVQGFAQDYPEPSWFQGFPELACFFNPDFSGKLPIDSHLLCQLSYRGISFSSPAKDLAGQGNKYYLAIYNLNCPFEEDWKKINWFPPSLNPFPPGEGILNLLSR